MNKRWYALGIVPLALIIAGGVAAWHVYRQDGRNTLPWQYYASHTPDHTATPTLDHVVIIVEENKPRSHIVGSGEAPYFNSLMQSYATATQYYSVTHPSLPNYLALTSGTTAGIHSDCNPPSGTCQAAVSNIADSIEAAHQTWKAYLETMPAPCTTTNSGDYAVKHNPFLYYPNIRDNQARCAAHDVPFSQLQTDLAKASTLPNYALVTPNLCNDMHNCDVKTGDDWLAAHVPAILGSPAFTSQHSLLVIVWDEGDDDSSNVPIVFAGPAAKRTYSSDVYYSHYSLLHTIEAAWQITPLTQNDRNAPLMSDMLQ